MYRCQKCGICVQPGIKKINVVVASRERVYEPSVPDSGNRGRFGRGRSGRRRKAVDNGGTGTEIVTEQSVCPTCAPELYGGAVKL